MTSRPSFLAELKRRNVIRVAIAYVAVSWLAMQAGTLLVQALELSNAIPKGLFVLLVIAFIPTLVFSWVYELTPEGLKREAEIERDESITHLTGRRLDYLVIGVMAGVIALLIVDKFVLTPRKAARAVASALASTPASSPTPVADPPAVQPAIGTAPPERSIAVLPFVNMSEEKANEYFADGISEELLNLLAKVPQLQVTARTSSFSFKGSKLPIPEIAKALHVAHVLEGSVRKAGDQVRITAQLINAGSDKHLWSQTYDRKLDDIFAIQDEIAADVVEQLKVKLLGAAPTARPTDPMAFALYLQARQLAFQNTADALKQSDALLRRMLEIDPRYAPAWEGLSRNFVSEANMGLLRIDEAYPLAREAAEKAVAIDPQYAPAHARLGRIANDQGDLAGAAQHLARALALDPSNFDVLRPSGTLLISLGRVQQAVGVSEYLVARDPVNPTAVFNLALYCRYVGRYDEAIAWFRKVLIQNPRREGTRSQLGMALILDGDAAGALGEIEQENNEVSRLLGAALAYHALGRKDESDAALAALIAKYEEDWSFNIASVHAFRGDTDKAFEWLENAVRYADPGLADLPAENLFDGIRKDPRWLPFLRKVGYAPEQLAAIKFEVKLPADPQVGTSAP